MGKFDFFFPANSAMLGNPNAGDKESTAKTNGECSHVFARAPQHAGTSTHRLRPFQVCGRAAVIARRVRHCAPPSEDRRQGVALKWEGLKFSLQAPWASACLLPAAAAVLRLCLPLSSGGSLTIRGQGLGLAYKEDFISPASPCHVLGGSQK